ncbi:copper homeostasis protein CutC [Mucilaginibacter sp. UR6-11]|uniref:copper homeostasis protein CutC n=1 Tax=Mucilaginibacter sp. UR6-11 TaxID=1435644 RepID=UPI001E5DD5E3|nr:copper homeostasis protein CutC [Mucilaginibacter sp. UR6-11]MCC8423354.1 copper homeostasis protein CutC [Mucilaginibacter sp. UR6-11]
MISLEVCANSINSALAAQEGGAIRVELCENLHDGGTTPSPGQIAVARKLLNIKLYVLIRPRGADFLYDDVEFETMLADVKYCIDAGCDGIVTGMLKADGTVDKERCGKLITLAKQAGLGVTFHRAFDMCVDQLQALEDIIELGCERILTSGGKSTAIEGVRTIAELVQRADGRISIMPGSGITEINVADLVLFTGVNEVHGTLLTRVKSKMLYNNDHIVMGSNYGDEYAVDVTSAERVRETLKKANNPV